MPDGENETGNDSEFSLEDAATYFIGVLMGMGVVIILYIGLSDVWFGTQLATAITYTGVVFWMVFFRTRAFDKGYRLSDEAVREKLPRLLAIHVVFLAVIVAGMTAAFAVQPRLPAYWLTEHARHHTWFGDGLVLICVSIGMFQVLISRGILSRSIEAKRGGSGTSHGTSGDDRPQREI